MLVHYAAPIATPTPRPRCDDQGYIGLGQPFPDMIGQAPRNKGRKVVTSIDRVSLNGKTIGYIYNLENGHRYFSRRTAITLTEQQTAALSTFVRRAGYVQHLSNSEIAQFVTQALNPPYVRIVAPNSAARAARLGIAHCL